eukprot:TRINITY_DN35159_c0_g1_i2.p1 TRINITY_DN35159_c0_g1~~TRINITY_DN35159_c0_g1_i2.p1  ORF type:complete len:359 (+),score=15.63 TRINITY_DN35159_c0_g1_i2:81-1079(+)
MSLSTELQLVVVCCLMFFGAWIFGQLPLSINKVNTSTVAYVQHGQGAAVEWMSCLGVGMLISTVFTIIVPEGMEAFSHQVEHEGITLPEWSKGAALLVGFLTLMSLETLQQTGFQGKRKDSSSPPPSDMENVGGQSSTLGMHSSRGCSAGHGHDHLSGHGGAMQAIVGLVIHSIADGLAVGVASLSENQDLNFAVGVAMVLHRGPVAFGLGSYLAKVNFPQQQSSRGILMFALASPIAAILTHFGLGYIPFFHSGGGVALCILFSGGSFLFAACMHILPEINDNQVLQLRQLWIMLLGAVGPLLFSMWHSHGHDHEVIHHGHVHLHNDQQTL